MRCILSGLLAWLLATAPAAAQALWEFEVLPPASVQPLPANTKTKSVSLVRVFVDMPPKERWATASYTISVNREYLYWESGRSEVDVKDLGPEFAQVLEANGFSAVGGRALFETQSSSDLQVGAIVSRMGARLCVACGLGIPAGAVRGSATMSVEWQVYSPIERTVLATVKTQAAYETRDSRPGMAHVLNGAFRENAKLLLNAPEFRRVVLAQPAAASAAAAAPLRISLATPKPRSIADATTSVVSVFANGGMGSGLLVSTEGYVLTNEHVVGGSKFVKVKWFDGVETLGEVVRSDRRRDIALIKTPTTKRSALVLRRTPVAVGEAVFAVGTPLDEKFQGSVTKGIVSATRSYEGLPYIQSDVVVNHGNSGGPLLDEKGAVIGITVSGIDIGGAPAGINLFIPIDDALKALALTPAS